MIRTLEASGQLVVPVGVRRRAGVKAGDRLKFEASRGVITIRKSEDEDDEYTPQQRAVIMERLEESLEDVRQGRVYGPFTTIADLERSLRLGKVSAAKPKSRTRS